MRSKAAWIVVSALAAFIALGDAVQTQTRSVGSAGSDGQRRPGWLQHASIMGEDARSTVEEFAKHQNVSPEQVRWMISATGRMVCGRGRSTVQLVGADPDQPSRLVVAHAHSFYRSQDCARVGIEACEIQFPLSSRSDKVYRINLRSYQDGGRCPFPTKSSGNPIVGEQRFSFDWSVFELTEDVSGVRPYALPEPGSMLESGATVLHVAAWSVNFRKAGEYALQYCEAYYPPGVARNRPSRGRFLLRHNCDTGWQASGSALLKLVDGRLTVMGIHTIGSPHGDGQKFSRQNNFNRSVLMWGDFLKSARDKLPRVPTP